MIWFWIVFWWFALSVPVGVWAGRMLARAAAALEAEEGVDVSAAQIMRRATR